MSYTTVFLDRDGVINVDSPDYIKSWSEFHFIAGSREAIARLTENGITVIVISNQSAINRGMVALETVEGMHDRMCRAVADDGGRIADIFYCPHRPDENCDCRKPKPGLIHSAQRRHGLDLSKAVMVGDSAKDIRAGQAAGCGRTVLVRTGNGESAIEELNAAGENPDHVSADLGQAVQWIVGQGA